MKLPAWLFSVLTVVVFSSCGENKPSTPANRFSDAEIIRIQTLSDERKAAAVADYFKSPNPVYRAEAALCSASIQDTLLIAGLMSLLDDTSDVVVRNAVYSLGQFASCEVVPNLIDGYIERDQEARGVTLEAVGKILERATNDKRSYLLYSSAEDFYRINRPENEDQRIGWAKGIAALHRIGLSNDALLKQLKVNIYKGEYESRIHSAIALASAKEVWLKEAPHKKYIEDWVKSERDPDIRSIQMRMLGKIGDEESRKSLLGYATSSSQAQGVRVAAIRSLGKMKNQKTDELLPLLSDADNYIVHETLLILEGKISTAQIEQVKRACSGKTPWLKAHALKVAALAGDKTASEEVLQLFQTSDNKSRVFYASALAGTPANAKAIYNALIIEKEIPVLTALCMAFIEASKSKSFPKDIDYATALHDAFNQGDISVQALVASELKTMKLSETQKQKFNSTLKAAQAALKMPSEIETFNEIVSAINHIGIEKQQAAVAAYNHPIDWKKTVTIPKDQKILMTTSKGKVTIALDVESSPGSVTNMIQLIEQGFYNGKDFHRVIPNFVVQGGCPRGDGMGGTDYTIRSEFALHDYKKGAVGLASSGKDTESCQFFITHGSTPHLEGRYTIVGYVTDGQDVIELIIPGDVIEKVELI